MVKAVLTTKISPVYDDLPEERYHFPRTYLNQVSKAVGDWIVYYEPRRSTGDLSSRGGRQAYFGTARVERIYADPVLTDHFYAEVSDFLQFVRPVPFKESDRYYETQLEKADGSTNKGAFGRAVRNISDLEYDLIWTAGFGHVIGLEERNREAPDVPEEPMSPLPLLSLEPTPYLIEVPNEVDRRIIQQLVSRPFRDRAFSAAVKSA